MSKEDKYQVGLVLMGLLIFILLGVIGIMCIIINDLNSTIDRHLNSRNVCRTELKTLQNEFDEYRKDYFKDR